MPIPFTEILKVEDMLDQPTKQDEKEPQFLLQFEPISGYVEDLSNQSYPWLCVGENGDQWKMQIKTWAKS